MNACAAALDMIGFKLSGWLTPLKEIGTMILIKVCSEFWSENAVVNAVLQTLVYLSNAGKYSSNLFYRKIHHIPICL